MFPEKVENRIQKKWWHTSIVKLLGRKIGFKTLETRIKQMWVKDGIVNIIAIRNDYFLLKFSSKIDVEFTLIERPMDDI